ncbi:MAG: hypothetical protein JHC64_06080 [Mycolicibacterium sp.]|nr:hypothetical protein [Mycolicibacterium sp.]
MTALGPDTYGALADIGRKALGDSTALADIGRNAFGPDAFGGTSTLGDLGPKNYGAGLGSFLDSTALKSVEDRIGAPWIKHLGGGGTYGSLLDDALSPTSLVEEISPSHETVDVPKLSVSTLPVATNPLAPGYGNSDFFETVVDFTKWPLAARDLVAVLVTVSFLPVVLLFHLQGFDSALPAVEIVVALVTALVLRDRK